MVAKPKTAKGSKTTAVAVGKSKSRVKTHNLRAGNPKTANEKVRKVN